MSNRSVARFQVAGRGYSLTRMTLFDLTRHQDWTAPLGIEQQNVLGMDVYIFTVTGSAAVIHSTD